MNINYKKLDKVFLFFEENGIKIIMYPFLLFFMANKFLLVMGVKFGSSGLDNFFSESLRSTLIMKDGTLITIAAVFIGIYFTVFTLLSSLRIDSTFSILTEQNFYRLLKYIKNAFLGSFLYLMYSLFSPLITNEWFSTFLSLSLLLYMLLSALRFGFIIYNIFSKDVEKYYKQLEIEKVKNREKENLDKKLLAYLNEQELKSSSEYSKKFSDENF